MLNNVKKMTEKLSDSHHPTTISISWMGPYFQCTLLGLVLRVWIKTQKWSSGVSITKPLMTL